MALDWHHAPRRYLYTEESAAFGRLPVLTRAFAAELLKFCDRFGVIPVGGEDPVTVVCRRVGAHAGERRQIRAIIPALVADGYLVAVPGALYVHDFLDAQYHRDADRLEAMRAERESVLSRARVEHERCTNGARTVHERCTKIEPTPRNDTTHVVPSVPVRSGPKEDTPYSPPREPRLPTVERSNALDPTEVWDTLERASGGRLVWNVAARLQATFLAVVAESRYTLADLRALGAYVGAGGLDWTGRKRIDLVWLLGKDRDGGNLSTQVLAAREWADARRREAPAPPPPQPTATSAPVLTPEERSAAARAVRESLGLRLVIPPAPPVAAAPALASSPAALLAAAGIREPPRGD